MKYFGEYLYEKQIIPADKLVQAVLQQNQNLPLAAQIAYETKIFTAEEMIGIFSHQHEHQLDFYAAGLSSGLMTADKKEALDEELQKRHLPLASILLKNGTIGVKELVHALDEFLSTAPTPSVTTPAALKGNSALPSNVISFKFSKIDPTFSKELEAALSQNKILEIINVLQLVKQNASTKELVQEFLQDVLRSIHTIRGLAKAAKANLIDQVCSLMDNAIVKEIRSEQPNTKHITESLTPSLEQALTFCEGLKDAIAKTQSEELFWEQTNNQDLYRALSTKLGA